MITKRLVDTDRERNNFLPKRVKDFIKFEKSVYKVLDDYCKDYNGDYWLFYELSNGGFYLAPDSEKTFHLDISSNYYSGDMSADAAGIVATLFALNRLTWETNGQYNDEFYQLREFAVKHKEAAEIFAAID